MHRSVSKGTKDLLLFKMPMQEAMFLEICSICTFQVKFTSIYNPRDLQYAVHCSEVYKLATKSQFTFQYLYTMKTYLHNLMGNEAFKDRLRQHI